MTRLRKRRGGQKTLRRSQRNSRVGLSSLPRPRSFPASVLHWKTIRNTVASTVASTEASND